MELSQMFPGKPFSWRSVKELLLPGLTEDEICELEIGNLWMSYRIALIVSVLETCILGFSLLYYRRELSAQRADLLSVAACLCVCLLSVALIRIWHRMEWVSRKGIQVFTELLYWVLSIWGMCGAFRHYAAGEQMLVFDTVQVCFALLMSCHPLRALTHILGSFGGLYWLLWRFDGASQLRGLNFFALAALLWSSYLLHFRKELLTVRLQAAQRDQILDLESASTHDALTGLKNRRALRKDFSGYVGKRVWAVMADVDYFKQYNDTFGHVIGDRFLAAVGESIRAQFGEQCTYRYGGDEFLLFVEGEDEAQVLGALKQWEGRVAQITVETAVERLRPRCSCGVSGGLIQDEGELRCHLRIADQRLYQIKESRIR